MWEDKNLVSKHKNWKWKIATKFSRGKIIEHCRNIVLHWYSTSQLVVFTGELILTGSDLKTEIGLKHLFSKLAYIFLLIKKQ